jgi:cyclase
MKRLNSMTMMRRLAAIMIAVVASVGYLRAQQTARGEPVQSAVADALRDWGVPLPQPYFRAPEDTRKTGEKPGEIRAGVVPDYDALLDPLVVIPVQGDVYLIGGAGANIAMQVTDEGVLLVDAGDERAGDRVIATWKQYQRRRPLRWVINTSADVDHTGANEKVARSGEGGLNSLTESPAGLSFADQPTAGIFAFETVLTRMGSSKNQTSRATAAWPTDTFVTPTKSFYFGHQPLELIHQAAAHSDGDVMVFFRTADVIAAGDILADDRYPVIEADQGGTIQGVLDGLNALVRLAVAEYNQQGGTRVIPGHGRVCNQSDVVEYRDMVTIVRDRVALLARQGRTLAEIKAARPTLEYDGLYGTNKASTADMFIEAAYREATKSSATGR